MRNQPRRVSRLEASQQSARLTPTERARRVAVVIANPARAAAIIGRAGVDRILELLDIAKTRREAARNDEQ
jgi:hypothetical protein